MEGFYSRVRTRSVTTRRSRVSIRRTSRRHRHQPRNQTFPRMVHVSISRLISTVSPGGSTQTGQEGTHRFGSWVFARPLIAWGQRSRPSSACVPIIR